LEDDTTQTTPNFTWKGIVPPQKWIHIFHINGITYALSTQWGGRVIEAVDLLNNAFKQVEVSYAAVDK
jgi:hypothetical protein